MISVFNTIAKQIARFTKIIELFCSRQKCQNIGSKSVQRKMAASKNFIVLFFSSFLSFSFFFFLHDMISSPTQLFHFSFLSFLLFLLLLSRFFFFPKPFHFFCSLFLFASFLFYSGPLDSSRLFRSFSFLFFVSFIHSFYSFYFLFLLSFLPFSSLTRPFLFIHLLSHSFVSFIFF